MHKIYADAELTCGENRLVRSLTNLILLIRLRYDKISPIKYFLDKV